MRLLDLELAPGARVVLAGLGVRGRGDDAFGPRLVDRLAECCPPDWTLIDCGDRLEDYTGDIALPEPHFVLIADAVDVGALPGSVVLAARADLPPSVETHRASLATSLRYLEMRTGADVRVLGVQPAFIGDDDALSAPVSAALEHLTGLMCGDRPAFGHPGGNP